MKCRGLAAAVAGRVEARCAEAFRSDNAGVSAAIVVVDLGGTVRDVRLQRMVPVLSARDGKKEI